MAQFFAILLFIFIVFIGVTVLCVLLYWWARLIFWLFDIMGG